MSEVLRELVKEFEQYDFQKKTNKLAGYDPYPYQLKFHNAKGHLTDSPAQQRFLMAGNGTGKTSKVTK